MIRMMVSLLLLMVAMGAWGQAAPDPSKMPWIITDDLDTHADVGPVVKSNIENSMRDAFDLMPESYRHSTGGMMKLSQIEADYYLVGHTTVVKDFLTFYQFYYRQKNELCVEAKYPHDGVHCKRYFDMWVELSKDWNLPFKELKPVLAHVTAHWHNKDKREAYGYGEDIIHGVMNPNKILTDYYILKTPFFSPPQLSTLYSASFKWKPHHSDTNANSSNSSRHEHKHNSSEKTLRVYNAQSPLVSLSKFLSDGTTVFNTDNITNIDIFTENRVKVFVAHLYKDGSTTPYRTFSKYSRNTHSENDGIQSFVFNLQKDGKLEEGNYKLVVGAIDKFNKMYIFEPRKFTVDDTPPTYTLDNGKPFVNGSEYLNKENPVLLHWGAITDNLTTHDSESKFIFIKPSNSTVYTRITELISPSIFAVEGNTVKVNAESDQGLFDFILRDEAGNETPLATQKRVEFSSVKPSLAKQDQQGRIYRHGDRVFFDVNDVTGKLMVSKARFTSNTQGDTLDLFVPLGLPVTLSSTKYNQIVTMMNDVNSGYTAQQKQLFTGSYGIAGNNTYYKLNDMITSTQEDDLRSLLFKLGLVEYETINQLVVPLDRLPVKDGSYTLELIVKDIAGNSNFDVNNLELSQFTVTVTSSVDDVRMSLQDGSAVNTMVLPEGVVAEFNPVGSLFIEKIEPAVTSYDLSITSLGLDTGITGITVNKTGLTAAEHIEPLTLTPTLDSELLEIVVTAHYGVAKTVQYKRRVTVYDDIAAPGVVITNNSDGSKTVTVSDGSAIKHVAVKEVDQGAAAPTVPSLTNGEWDLTGWTLKSGNLKENIFKLYPAPGKEYYIFAVDRWGQHNGAAMGYVPGSSLQSTIVIDEQLKLENYINSSGEYELKGTVRITCDLTIGAGKTLLFTSDPGTPTTVYLQSGIGGRLKIVNNGGTIKLNSSNAPISFQGIGESTNGYNWFGIVNESGTLDITSTNRISFSSAEAALTINSPSGPRTLDKLDFTNCLIGIHWLDNGGAEYNKLTVTRSTFTKCVYGVKLDLIKVLPTDSYVDTSDTGHINYVLIDNTNSFNNMSRAKFYWNGLDFK